MPTPPLPTDRIRPHAAQLLDRLFGVSLTVGLIERYGNRLLGATEEDRDELLRSAECEQYARRFVSCGGES